MTRISGDRLTQFSEHLLAEKRRLWGEVRRELFKNIGEEMHSPYEFPQDPGEQGGIDLLEDIGLAETDIRRQELTQIEEALGRLADGTYGLCEGCGREIDVERLRVAPYASRCIDCQKQLEGPSSGRSSTF